MVSEERRSLPSPQVSPVKAERPIVMWDLDDLLLQGINRDTAFYVERVSEAEGNYDYPFGEVLRRGRVTKTQDRKLYDYRQRYFRDPKPLEQVQADPDAHKALSVVSEMAVNEILTGRPEHLRPNIESLLAERGLRDLITGDINLRGDGEEYKLHKIMKAARRNASMLIDDDAEACQVAGSSGVFAVVITKPWNKELPETPFIRRFESLGEFADTITGFGSIREFSKDHFRRMNKDWLNKLQIELLARGISCLPFDSQ